MDEVSCVEIDDAEFLAFVAEEPGKSIAVACFVATAFPSKFLEAAAMAEASAEMLIHLGERPDVDSIFDRRARSRQGFQLGPVFAPLADRHGDDGGDNRRDEEHTRHAMED